MLYRIIPEYIYAVGWKEGSLRVRIKKYEKSTLIFWLQSKDTQSLEILKNKWLFLRSATS